MFNFSLVLHKSLYQLTRNKMPTVTFSSTWRVQSRYVTLKDHWWRKENLHPETSEIWVVSIDMRLTFTQIFKCHTTPTVPGLRLFIAQILLCIFKNLIISFMWISGLQKILFSIHTLFYLTSIINLFRRNLKTRSSLLQLVPCKQFSTGTFLTSSNPTTYRCLN